MTWYVERDGAGNIKGVRRTPEPGLCDEELAEGNAEVMDFLNGLGIDRRRVDRRTIIERLAAVDLLDVAEAALLAAPAVVRWRWNTTDAVYADDPDTLGFLKAIGADPGVILAP